MISLTAFFGRMHLLLLHLPIGFLVLAGIMVVASRLQKKDAFQSALHLTALVAALSAAVAAGCGWLLAQDGSYDESLLQRHQWLGFASATLAIITWLLRHTKWFHAAIFVTLGAVSLAGHFGGSLTHGEGYLTEPLNREADQGDAIPENFSGLTAYEARVRPILEKRCTSCHNPNKKKGDLLLDSPEGLLTGGKNGPVLVPGRPDSSTLYRRITLPAHDEDRMPPKGKKALSPSEIALIGQWIELGASFSLPADALEVPESAGIPVFPPVQVEVADADLIGLLLKNQVSVTRLGQDVPWLSVSLTGRKNIDAACVQLLKKVKSQAVHLDLGHTNADDALLSALRDMPNLTRVNLSNTPVTNAGLKNLSGLKYLNYLNITNTNVDDGAVETLCALPALQNLYVWKSGMTDAGLEQLKSRVSGLQIDKGAAPDSTTAMLQLRAPKLLYGRNIFEDTVQVMLDFPFKNVGLFYTLDQASPTTQSYRYKGTPLVFDQSVTLRAIAAREGWENSPPVEASFVKRKWSPKTVVLASPPSPKYPGSGAASLSDGQIGPVYTDKTFIGYEGEHLIATLDFGTAIDFHRLSVHYAENNGSWIFAPHGLQVWTSDDGHNWKPCIRAQYPVPGGMQEIKTGIISEPAPQPVKARFLKVKVESLLKNPGWHPGAGQKCWVFADEILVE